MAACCLQPASPADTSLQEKVAPQEEPVQGCPGPGASVTLGRCLDRMQELGRALSLPTPYTWGRVRDTPPPVQSLPAPQRMGSTVVTWGTGG